MSTWASRCSGVISTIGLNSMRAGRTPEMACADVAKNSYCKYFNVCSVESKMSPLYSSRMYNHSKICLSTSWNAILDDSSIDCACNKRRSVLRRPRLTQSSCCFLETFSSDKRRRRFSKCALRLLLFTKWLRIGCMMLKSMSRLSFAIALWGASVRTIWFVASFILQQSDLMRTSSTCVKPAMALSDNTKRPSPKRSTLFMKVSTRLYTSCIVSSKTQKSLTMPSKTGSRASPENHFPLSTLHSVRMWPN
mmetsp:Transcript_19758/g.54401  ORF Transcript_19758/g.54401 Transcript_19758/m.54401 type:complete len:250 (+) Transcript_19758:1188-1937(+)